jgi:hypothetical protein
MSRSGDVENRENVPWTSAVLVHFTSGPGMAAASEVILSPEGLHLVQA